MSTNQKLFLSLLLYAASFVVYYFSFQFYDGNYDLVVDLINNNDLTYNLCAISEWCFVSSTFVLSTVVSKHLSNKFKWIEFIKISLRITLVALTFSTLNELAGLNVFLDIMQFPIFWGVMVLTIIYSYIKHK